MRKNGKHNHSLEGTGDAVIDASEKAVENSLSRL